MKKRILVTGGAGFIGSHLSEMLLSDGHEVICVDNLFTGTKDNIKHLLENHNFEVVRHDICFPLYLEVDEVYNLACPASPIHYQFDPVQTTKVNVLGSINMLGLAKRLKIRIFQASTSEVYGNPTVHPQPETYWGNVNPIGKCHSFCCVMVYLNSSWYKDYGFLLNLTTEKRGIMFEILYTFIIIDENCLIGICI